MRLLSDSPTLRRRLNMKKPPESTWIKGLSRRPWQHANFNANHPLTTVFECRQCDDKGNPLGHIECRPLVGNTALDDVKIFKSVEELKENWDW